MRDVRQRVRVARETAAASGRDDRALRLRTLVLDRMAEGVSIADEHGVIVYTNLAADRMLGYEPGELVGQHLTIQNSYPPEENARIVGEVVAQLARRRYWEGEWDSARKDGTSLVAHVRITAVELDGAPHWICVQEDVTERRQAARRQTFLDEASALLDASVADARTLVKLVRHCVPALADFAGIDLLTDDGAIRHVGMAHVDPARERVVRALWARNPTSDAVGVAESVRTGQPRFVPELHDARMETFARDAEQLALLRELAPRSYIAVPLATRGRTYGALSLVRVDRSRGGSGQRFAPADLELALELARRVAGAVDDARALEAERSAREAAETASRRIAAQHAVGQVLAAAEGFREAIPDVLRALGEQLGWPYAACWCAAGSVDTLHMSAVWHAPGDAHQPVGAAAAGFEAASREIAFRRGVGLVGRVWETGAPAWITRAADDGDFPRRAAAIAAGFTSAFGFPIRSAGEVFGVIELFHHEERTPDPALLQTVSSVGGQIGQFIERKRAERRLREREAAHHAERERLLEAERAARAEAEEARARAEEANRSKSQFLATMSHELRTPLNAIAGHVQLLELGIHGPVLDAQRDALARIGRAQHHLLGLINDVLNYARIESGRVEYDMQPVRAADVVRDVLPMVEPQLLAKGLAFDAPLPEDGGSPLLVWADREKLTQILLNLLSNAVKFTPAGGRLTVALSGREDGGGPPGFAYLRVSDTGVGIPSDKLEAVFEPFVQVRSDFTRDTGGTGLGLAISRDLARGMGGELRARSTEGLGSAFTVTLRRVLSADGRPTDRRTGGTRRFEEERRRGEDRRHDGPADHDGDGGR